MPFMTTARTVLDEPNGQDMVRFSRGFEVAILKENDGWLQVQRGAIVGWVPKDAVSDTSPLPPETTIDSAAFFRQCWLDGLSYAVLPHYLAAVAKLRSNIKNDSQDLQVGPFRFLKAEWDAGRQSGALGLTDFVADDISDWGFQCAMFAAITAQEFERAAKVLGRSPSAHELYLAQLIGSQAVGGALNNPAATIKTDLDAVADADLPIGGSTREQIMSRYAKYLLDSALKPLPASEAFDSIATDLQAALDAVKSDIITAGNDILGTTPSDASVVNNAKQPGAAQPASGQLPNVPSGEVPGAKPGAGGHLGQLIARGEGDYSTFNRGNAGDSTGKKINFSLMSIRDIMTFQALPAGNPQRLFAVGKYQVIPITMRGAVTALAIDASKTFAPPMQENVFRNYLIAIKRPSVKQYITGQSNNLLGAQFALALEFASVADPNTGRSHYGGSGGNRASITSAETATALNDERTQYKENLDAGMSSVNAWDALSDVSLVSA